MLIDSGKRVKIVDISDYYWNDVGHPWQLLDTNRYVLSKLLPEEPVINLGANYRRLCPNSWSRCDR